MGYKILNLDGSVDFEWTDTEYSLLNIQVQLVELMK